MTETSEVGIWKETWAALQRREGELSAKLQRGATCLTHQEFNSPSVLPSGRLHKARPSPFSPSLVLWINARKRSSPHSRSDVISCSGLDFILLFIIAFLSLWLQPFMQGLQRMVCSALWFYVFLSNHSAVFKTLSRYHFQSGLHILANRCAPGPREAGSGG